MEEKFYYYIDGEIVVLENRSLKHAPAFETIEEAKAWGEDYNLKEYHTHSKDSQEFYMAGETHAVLAYVYSKGPYVKLSPSERAAIELATSFLKLIPEKTKAYNEAKNINKKIIKPEPQVEPVAVAVVEPDVVEQVVQPVQIATTSMGGGSSSGGGGGGGY